MDYIYQGKSFFFNHTTFMSVLIIDLVYMSDTINCKATKKKTVADGNKSEKMYLSNTKLIHF